MYKVLLVDDEQYIIDMLLDLFAYKYNKEELDIYTANSGASALEILRNNKIDIILLDINMPGINGFEVAKQVEINWPDCHIIFLTGSDSFDYIYEASKKKNIKYILKMESDDVILGAVDESIQSIESALHNKTILQQSHQKELWIYYLVTREVFKSFMNGSDLHKVITANGLSHTDFSIQLDKKVYLMYTNIRFNKPNISLLKNQLYLLQFKSYLEQTLQDRFNIELYVKDTSTLLFFLQEKETTFKDQEIDIDPFVFLSESLDNYGVFLSNNYDITPLIMLYNEQIPLTEIPNLSRTLDDYYTDHYLKNTLVSPLSLNVSAKDLASKPQNTISSITAKLQEDITSVEFLLYQKDIQKLLPLLDSIYEKGFPHKSMHHLESIEIYQMISLKYLHYINHLQINESLAPKIGLSSLFFLGNFSDWKQAFSYLKKLSKTIVTLINDQGGDKNELLIITIKKYIKDNLHKNLTLSSIANHVNYNSSYISRTFKKQTSKSITEYIRNVKVDKAKSDLTNTNKSISQISEELGYETSQYFSITFKKATGISPSEYRSKNILSN